jgi:hypothetical protein
MSPVDLSDSVRTLSASPSSSPPPFRSTASRGTAQDVRQLLSKSVRAWLLGCARTDTPPFTRIKVRCRAVGREGPRVHDGGLPFLIFCA